MLIFILLPTVLNFVAKNDYMSKNHLENINKFLNIEIKKLNFNYKKYLKNILMKQKDYCLIKTILVFNYTRK